MHVFRGVVAALGMLLPVVAGAKDGNEAGRRQIVKSCAPVYPALARQMHVDGTVVLSLTIAADGTVTRTELAMGHPLLAEAAKDAAKCGRYAKSGSETTQTIRFDFRLQS